MRSEQSRKSLQFTNLCLFYLIVRIRFHTHFTKPVTLPITYCAASKILLYLNIETRVACISTTERNNMGNKKKVTFDDIAKYTHFSKTTISRYFNHPDSLTLENQQIISDALEKLNYQENKVARILANGKTEFIGVIISDLYHHFFSEVLNRILSTYETFGYKFLVFIGNEHEDTERQYIQELLSYQIEGMIIMSHTIPSLELSALPIPIVAIEREDQHISSINTDNYMGGYQAAALLAVSILLWMYIFQLMEESRGLQIFAKSSPWNHYCTCGILDAPTIPISRCCRKS